MPDKMCITSDHITHLITEVELWDGEAKCEICDRPQDLHAYAARKKWRAVKAES